MDAKDQRIALLEAELETLKELHESTREEIVQVGAKLVPIVKMLELDKMFKPDASPNVAMIIMKVSARMLKHWSAIQALIHKDQNFFAQLIHLFLVKYGADIQQRREQHAEQFLSGQSTRAALGAGATNHEQPKAIGG